MTRSPLDCHNQENEPSHPSFRTLTRSYSRLFPEFVVSERQPFTTVVRNSRWRSLENLRLFSSLFPPFNSERGKEPIIVVFHGSLASFDTIRHSQNSFRRQESRDAVCLGVAKTSFLSAFIFNSANQPTSHPTLGETASQWRLGHSEILFFSFRRHAAAALRLEGSPVTFPSRTPRDVPSVHSKSSPTAPPAAPRRGKIYFIEVNRSIDRSNDKSIYRSARADSFLQFAELCLAEIRGRTNGTTESGNFPFVLIY